MMRQSSNRNQRPKGGFRLKYVLQICLLLAICSWLLYQVKHSHDKKRAFEERITRDTSKVSEKQLDLFNFGRKSLPLADENDSMTESRSKEEDNEEEGQEEEGEQEHDVKHEEFEDEEGKGDVDDKIDEQDQDRGDDENERDEEFTSEEEKDGQAEEEDFFDNQEHDDTSQEAREENYKRDDVSSAVVHEVNVTETDMENTDMRGSYEGRMENPETRDVKMENSGRATNGTVDDSKSNNNSTLGNLVSLNNISDIPFGENITVPTAYFPVNNNSSDNIVEFPKPENESFGHPGSSEDSNQKVVPTNSTISNLPTSNTEMTDVPTMNASDSEMGIGNNSTMNVFESNKELSQNGTSSISVRDENIILANGTSGEESMIEHNERFNRSETHEAEHNPTTSDMANNGAAAQGQPGDMAHNSVTVEERGAEHKERFNRSETHEAEHNPTTSNMTNNGAAAQGQPGDMAHNSVTVEEREAHIDLSTFPDISNEVKHGNDEAAE